MDATLVGNILKYENTLTGFDIENIWYSGGYEVRKILAKKATLPLKIQKQILADTDEILHKSLACNSSTESHILLKLINKYGNEVINLLVLRDDFKINKKIALKIIENKKYILCVLYRDNLPSGLYVECLKAMEEPVILDSYSGAKQFSEKILKNKSDLGLAFLNNESPKNVWAMTAAVLIDYKKVNLYSKIIEILEYRKDFMEESGFINLKTRLIHDGYSQEIFKKLSRSTIFSENEKQKISEKLNVFKKANGDTMQGAMCVVEKSKLIYRFNETKAVNLCKELLSSDKVNSKDLLLYINSSSFEIFKKLFENSNFEEKLRILTIRPSMDIFATDEELLTIIRSGKLPPDVLSKISYLQKDKNLVIEYVKPLRNYIGEDFVVKALNSVVTPHNIKNILELASTWEGSLQDLLEMLEKV